MDNQPNSPELARYIKESVELQNILNEDTEKALEMFRFGTHEFCTRTMVRTMAAEFEARIFFLGEFLIGLHETGDKSFILSVDEVHILKSTTLNIKKNGDISESQKFYPLKERLLFILKLAARIFNPKAMPNTSSNKWESVGKFVDIRNRLAHPKKMDDLNITEEEIDHINRAQDWIRGSMTAIFYFPEYKKIEKLIKERALNENS